MEGYRRVWGDDSRCPMFDKSYDHKGWAVRRAKKMLESGEAVRAAVMKPVNGSFYTVVYCSGAMEALLLLCELAIQKQLEAEH
jgi:hypothetical protein